MKKAISRVAAGGILVASVLWHAGRVGADEEKGESREAKALPASVSILCEVWRTTDADLVRELEALTDEAPGNADPIRKRLQSAAAKAKRISRFVSATASGKVVTHDDTQQAAMQVSGPGGRRGFGGFVKTGARLEMTATIGKESRVAIEFEVEVSGVGDAKSTTPAPPDRFTSKLKGTVTAPSNVLRMHQSNTKGSETLYVFLRATKL